VAVNFYAAIPLMAVLAILQTAVLPRIPIAGLEPQLVFLVARPWPGGCCADWKRGWCGRSSLGCGSTCSP